MELLPPDPPLADALVSLRPLAMTDIATVEAALGDPEICRWFDNRGVTAREVVQRALERWQAGEAAEFAIVEAGNCVGSLWLTLGADGRATVGYWLLPGARGKGLATSALRLVSGWAFDGLGVKRIGLLADPRNAASVRAAERAGFAREGVLRSWADVNGERVDHASFSLLPVGVSGPQGVVIRPYEERDERGWLICRLLSFFDTAFFDAVEREKEHYDRDAIELVAEKSGTIIGLLDLECESDGLSSRPGAGGMIWHLATHPDHQRLGVASALLTEAERQACERGLVRIEAWTRDDASTQRWYERHGFQQIDSYLHVYLERDDLRAFDGELRLVKAFGHYTGADRDEIRQRFARVHDDVLYEKRLSPRTA